MILGLDISTSITGYTLIDGDKVILNDAWDTRKFKDFFDKVIYVKTEMGLLNKRFGGQIEAVYIEQSLQSFRSGFSSAKTLSTLSRFNGIISWLVLDTFGIKPEYIAAPTARKLCGIKIPRGQKAKTVVLNYLLENEDSFQIEYTKFGNPRPESYDKADSLIIAKAGYHLSKENIK
jgi:hypothetical protein